MPTAGFIVGTIGLHRQMESYFYTIYADVIII
jgi:hypothetical protein